MKKIIIIALVWVLFGTWFSQNLTITKFLKIEKVNTIKWKSYNRVTITQITPRVNHSNIQIEIDKVVANLWKEVDEIIRKDKKLKWNLTINFDLNGGKWEATWPCQYNEQSIIISTITSIPKLRIPKKIIYRKYELPGCYEKNTVLQQNTATSISTQETITLNNDQALKDTEKSEQTVYWRFIGDANFKDGGSNYQYEEFTLDQNELYIGSFELQSNTSPTLRNSQVFLFVSWGGNWDNNCKSSNECNIDNRFNWVTLSAYFDWKKVATTVVQKWAMYLQFNPALELKFSWWRWSWSPYTTIKLYISLQNWTTYKLWWRSTIWPMNIIPVPTQQFISLPNWTIATTNLTSKVNWTELIFKSPERPMLIPSPQ